MGEIVVNFDFQDVVSVPGDDLPPFVAPLVILSGAALAILFILYRIYETRVEQPKKLDDELKEALEGRKADVEAVEPVRKCAAAICYALNRIVIVRDFGKKPPRIYPVAELMGIEVFVDDKVVARVLRNGPHKMLDDIAPQVNRVTMRMMFDDPAHPDFELVLWDPHDALTARAEGPRAAMETARRWFYHVEAILRRPAPEKPKPLPPAHPSAPEPAKTGDKPPRGETDVLNAPLIPYL